MNKANEHRRNLEGRKGAVVSQEKILRRQTYHFAPLLS
jgi:hypothetical protein